MSCSYWFTDDIPSPFVQRVWIALELKGVDYQYYEVDPYEKPKILTDISPNSLIPAIRHGNWSCHESTVLLEYVRLPILPALQIFLLHSKLLTFLLI